MKKVYNFLQRPGRDPIVAFSTPATPATLPGKFERTDSFVKLEKKENRWVNSCINVKSAKNMRRNRGHEAWWEEQIDTAVIGLQVAEQ